MFKENDIGMAKRQQYTDVYCSTIHNSEDEESAWVPIKIKKMWYTHTMEYYWPIKKNGILSFATKWVELEVIVLNTISQRKKDSTTCCLSSVKV
jgi:hypothetical protein